MAEGYISKGVRRFFRAVVHRASVPQHCGERRQRHEAREGREHEHDTKKRHRMNDARHRSLSAGTEIGQLRGRVFLMLGTDAGELRWDAGAAGTVAGRTGRHVLLRNSCAVNLLAEFRLDPLLQCDDLLSGLPADDGIVDL